MTEVTSKPKLHFSRKLLAIPYGLFLLAFVIVPLFIVLYYAFTDDTGKFTFFYVKMFFNENGEGILGFFKSYNFKTIMQSLFISFMSTVLCLAIAYQREFPRIFGILSAPLRWRSCVGS